MKEEALNRIIIIGVIIATILTGIIVFPYKKPSTTTATSNVPAYTYDALKIRTDMPKSIVPAVNAFVSSAIRAELLPKELLINLSQKATGINGDAYIASWNQNGTYISILVTLTSNNSHINYQRIWIMPDARNVTTETATSLLKGLFQPSYLTTVGQVSCADTIGPSNKTLTDCSKMKTLSSGDLIGISVRSPIEMLPPPGTVTPTDFVPQHVTIVSGCFVPKDGTPNYTASYCI